MKIVKTLADDIIVVKITKRTFFQGRKQTLLRFANEYADALRAALKAVRVGFQDVTVIQRREILHDHEDLQRALPLIPPEATDLDVIEQVHYASRQKAKPEGNWQQFVRNCNPIVWGSAVAA